MTAVLQHQSLPTAVEQVLRRRILNNELPSGSRLVEASIATELGVSRTTVREAMRELAAEGLIEIYPRRHSVVTRMSADVVEDICFARAVLEAGIARSLPAKDRQALAGPLQTVLDEMTAASEAGDVEALVECDTRFHGLIVHASPRRRAIELWTTMNSQMGALMRSSIDRQESMTSVRDRHEPIAEVLAEGNPRSIERIIRDHYVPVLPAEGF